MSLLLATVLRESIPWIDIFHAAYNARDFRRTTAPQGYLQLFVAFILSSLGGTLLTALILGQPISWLANDLVFGTYAAVFVLAFAPWTRGAFHTLVNAPVVRTVISAMEDLALANSISTLGVQRALHPVHADSPIRNAVAAAIVCGITSGCGGGLIRSMLNFNNSTWSFTSPRHLNSPHWPIQQTSAMSVLYYLLLNPHGYLPYHGVTANEARWTLIVICVTLNTVWNSLDLSALLSYSNVGDPIVVPAKKHASMRKAVAPAHESDDEKEEETAEEPKPTAKSRSMRSPVRRASSVRRSTSSAGKRASSRKKE